MTFKIDFSQSDIEAEGTTAVFNAMPTGDYPVIVSDLELVEVSKGDNQGKPMFKVTLTVDDPDSEYNNRKLWCNVMMFTVYGRDGKPNNFFLSQFLKATGNGDALDTGIVPDADAFIGKKIIVAVKRTRKTYGVDPKDDPIFINEVKSFISHTTEAVEKGKTRKANSMLP